MPPLYYYCAISLNSLKHFLATGFPSFLDHLNFAHSDLPFDMAQGGESLDSARDLEPVEGLVEPFRISSFVLRIWLRLCRAVFFARDPSTSLLTCASGIAKKDSKFVGD